MKKIAVVTDSNSGITPEEAIKLGVQVIPMPFCIDGKDYFEDINLTQEDFYRLLENDADILTSQPAIGNVTDVWRKLLKEVDEVIAIPMSSGLSKTCETSVVFSQELEFKNRVFVVNNQRISVTQRQSVLDALQCIKKGMSGSEIQHYLEEHRFDSSIYIMVDTLKYLCKGGRVTPAAATFGKFFGIKPVLQIRGEKLDAFAKVRGTKKAKTTMIEAMRKDLQDKFHLKSNATVHMQVAYTKDRDAALLFLEEIKQAFPHCKDYVLAPLSLSVACHIGPGAIAVACCISSEIAQ